MASFAQSLSGEIVSMPQKGQKSQWVKNTENKEFNERMVASIPEMFGPYKAAIEWWAGGDPGSTVLVEGNLMPLVYKALGNGGKVFLAKFALWVEIASEILSWMKLRPSP